MCAASVSLFIGVGSIIVTTVTNPAECTPSAEEDNTEFRSQNPGVRRKENQKKDGPPPFLLTSDL
jgi:hypothetical protein